MLFRVVCSAVGAATQSMRDPLRPKLQNKPLYVRNNPYRRIMRSGDSMTSSRVDLELDQA